jgi:hypothetical protein
MVSTKPGQVLLADFLPQRPTAFTESSCSIKSKSANLTGSRPITSLHSSSAFRPSSLEAVYILNPDYWGTWR